MKRTLTALALGALMMVPPVLAPTAEAAHGDWVFGARFRVGNALLNIGYATPAYGHHRPVYYYRTQAPLRYRGHRCHDRCYHRGGYNYHYATCPVVNRHFRHHRVDARAVFARHAPRYGGYDRYDRGYDRDRYDDRGRGRGYYRDDDRGRGRGYYRDDHRRHDRRHHGRHDRDRHRGHHHRGGHCEYDD